MKVYKNTKKSFNKNKYRISIYRSRSNIYAQIIDDSVGKTLVSANSLKLQYGSNIIAAKEVGKLIATTAIKNKITNVYFDRGSFTYKGRVKALADSAREHGLKF